jgi:hypothetical protein
MATEYKLSYTAQEIDKKLKEVVPPDFAQNDPSAPDYIKNRTHWAEAPVTTTTAILPESTIELEQGFYEAGTSLTLTENAEYTVTWDGVEYISVSKKIEEEGATVIVLGNTAELDGEDNGQPFMIAYLVEYSIIIVQSMDDVTASHTVGITQTITTQEIYKLDNKYIDAEWMAKPPIGYEEVSVISETTVTADDTGNGVFFASIIECDSSSIQFCNEVKFVVDGVEYTDVIKLSDGVKYFGNIKPLVVGDWGDGVPYIVIFVDGIAQIAFSTGGDHIISLMSISVVYEKIPMHYLPDDVGGLPEVVPEDEGAFLRVVNGEWKAVVLPSVEEGEF